MSKTSAEDTTNHSFARVPMGGYAWLSIAAAILMTGISLTGVLFPGEIYPNERLREAFYPNEIVNLFIGLPVLLGVLWAVRRGRLLGLLLWPGAVIYVLYTYLTYLIAMQQSPAYLFYLVLVVLSVYLLAGVVNGMDGAAVAGQLRGRVSERAAGGVMIAFGLLFSLRVAVMLSGPIGGGAALLPAELAANTADLIVSPAMVIGGVMLWRRQTFGYVVGLGLLFQVCMLFVALIAVMLLQPVMTDASPIVMDILIVAVMSLVGFVPLGLFIRGAGG